MKETEYWHSTDTFEQKLELLRAASERRDFRLARALTESLKNTLCLSAGRGKPRSASASSKRVRACG